MRLTARNLRIGALSPPNIKGKQAVEKGPPASLHSIASLQRISKYAYARRFLARLASGPFEQPGIRVFNSL
jgi:hypothetical protein